MLKDFQRDDLARVALVPGAILAWDKGLGKTWAMYLWPLLKERLAPAGAPRFATLLVAPGHLHAQIIGEGRERFRSVPVVLEDQAHFLRLARPDPTTGALKLEPGFYLTTYTALGANRVEAPWAAAGGLLALFERLYPQDAHPRYEALGFALAALPDGTAEAVEAIEVACRRAGLPVPETDYLTEAITLGNRSRELLDCLAVYYQAILHNNIGHAHCYLLGSSVPRPEHRLRCLYSPTLSDLCPHTFDAVVVDEAVRIKSDDTAIATGVHRLQPPHRLVLTATPIKNRLPDIFRLAWWAAGGRRLGHDRWRYAEDGRASFTDQHLVQAIEAKTRTRRRTAAVCQVHRLWADLAPVLVRRLKSSCGESLVPKHRHLIKVPLGREQARVYEWHLHGAYLDRNDQPAHGAKLQALRVAASCPTSPLLRPVETASGFRAGWRSGRDLTPKTMTALTLVEQMLGRNEQVIVFSAFHHGLDAFSSRLLGGGVPHLILDGRFTEQRRSQGAAEFKALEVPVLLAGIEAMSEGQSFPQCVNAIVLSYTWAPDKMEQAEDRIHRLTSQWPVNIYHLVTEGTVEGYMQAMLAEKATAAAMVLDGETWTDDARQLSAAELIQQAVVAFDRGGDFPEEAAIEAEWPELSRRLRTAALAWDPHPEPRPDFGLEHEPIAWVERLRRMRKLS